MLLTYDIPDIFDRRPVCMFCFCAHAELGLPAPVFFMRKKDFILQENGWLREYEEGIRIIHRIPVAGKAAGGPDTYTDKNRSEEATSRADSREFRADFGEIAYGGSSDGSVSTDAEDLPDVDDCDEMMSP